MIYKKREEQPTISICNRMRPSRIKDKFSIFNFYNIEGKIF